MPPVYDRLRSVLNPRSIAFIGASKDPEKWGFIVLANLLKGEFPGKIYPVNPREKEILGLEVYHTIAEIQDIPDLAVIVVPPLSIPQVIQDCLNKGIKGGLVITAGLAEAGDEGEQIEKDMVRLARQGGMVLVGPNSNGLISPYSRFYCAMPSLYPPPGSLAIVSQSGNIAQSLAAGIASRGLGVSQYVSSGNEADLNVADFFEYLEHDEPTRAILSYVEGFQDGRRFLEVASRVTGKKSIIMLKGGHTPAGARAAKSHTAALAGSDTIVNAACQQAGIIRVHNLDEMVDVGSVLVSQPLPGGDRVGIITAGGGYGVLVADALAQAGLEVAVLSKSTLKELDKYLPARWPRSNPVDRAGRSSLGEGINSVLLEILLSSAEVDGVLTLGIPIGGAGTSVQGRLEDFGLFLKKAIRLRDHYKKPVVSVPTWSLLIGETVTKLAALSRETKTAFYATPHSAATAYVALARYARYLRESSRINA